MIRIRNGENVIYDPRNPNLKLVSPRLVLEDNAAGQLTFQIYNTNLNYGTVRKLYPLISVERDGKTIFRGRAVSDKKDFYNGKTVEAEGKLAFLNDSCLEPFEFSGSPEELFRMIIENHNSQVTEWQQFRVGAVTVTDPNDYIVRSSESILNSWEALKSRCFQSSLGGHVRIRYEADGDYLDWLADYDRISGQEIAFARNMIDLSLEVDATETYTAIRPVGAEVEGKKIDISSVNGGKNYIVNEEKAAEYGIIFAPESESTWEDVTLPENLLRKAEERLSGSFITMKETYEIRAVDLNLTDADIEALDICEYVPVDSRPHGIHGNYLLYKADIAIAQPQNSVFWLGQSRRVLSDMNFGGAGAEIPRNVSSFRNDADYISKKQTEVLLKDYTKEEDVERIAGEAVSSIPAGPSAYEAAVACGFTGTEEEWLRSLQGEKGPAPVIGENGNWFVEEEDTGKPSRGEAGPAATVEVGTVTTGKPGTKAEVKNSGTESKAVLDFVIPEGQPGSGGGGSSSGMAGFGIREDGCLWIVAEDQAEADRYYINENGNLMYRIGDEMAVEINLGKVKLTEEEMEELVEQHTGGIRLGKDEEGNPGYYRYDEEAGADTFVPFKSGGARSVKLRQYGTTALTSSLSTTCGKLRLYIQEPGDVKRIVANGSISARNTSSTGTEISLYLYLKGTNQVTGSSSYGVVLATVKTYNKSISTGKTVLENVEVDLSAFDRSQPVYFNYEASNNVQIEIDMEYEIFY